MSVDLCQRLREVYRFSTSSVPIGDERLRPFLQPFAFDRSDSTVAR